MSGGCKPFSEHPVIMVQYYVVLESIMEA